MKRAVLFSSVIILGTFVTSASAGIITSVFDSSWTNMTVGAGEDIDDSAPSNVQVTPGYGGQLFDAEYLFYKVEGSILSIGLQTGFDVVNGEYRHTDGRDYYAGDLALSFDGTPGFEFAVDFGLETQSYTASPSSNAYDRHIIEVDGDGDDDSDGIDVAGLYSDVEWDNSIYFEQSAPFAMTQGNIKNVGFSSSSDQVGQSYYQIVSFDVSTLDISQLDAQWTMSCGNDVVVGHAEPSISVPEPPMLILLSTGLLGLLASGIAKRRKQA